MNKTRLILGIIATAISSVILLFCLIILSAGLFTTATLKYTMFSLFCLVLGIIAIATSGNSREKQEFEEYKRIKEQERAIYYRYANAKGTPIEEYMMDDRTKLITYYDRMPPKYQKQLLDRADTLYRRFENEKYLDQNNKINPKQ